VIETGKGVADTAQGWAEVSASTAISGFAIFRSAPKGIVPTVAGFITPWEGTVPLQTPTTAYNVVLPFDNTGGFGTGFAIGNLSNGQVSYTPSIYGEDGYSLGYPNVTLNPYGHTAVMVDSWSFTAKKRGVMVINTRNATVLGLRASPYGTLTSVPVAFR
jgi:hypothetical protein